MVLLVTTPLPPTGTDSAAFTISGSTTWQTVWNAANAAWIAAGGVQPSFLGAGATAGST